MGNDISSVCGKQRTKKKNSPSSKNKTSKQPVKDAEPLDTTMPFHEESTTSCHKKAASENRGGTSKPTSPDLQESATSFDRPSPKPRRTHTVNEYESVMITNVLTDVKERYHVNTKEIGHGHYGVVRKCMDRKTGEWYAIKSIRKSKVHKIEVLKREIEILKDVQHPNIIRLIEVHEDSKYLHLITELCTGGELFDRIIAKTQSPEGHFSEVDAADLVRCILDAIAYCHDEKQIVHRDLKPENFLFASKSDDAPIKIIDFGLSRYDVDPGNMMRTKVGTPYYVAPEVLNRKYDKSCDIWSIGVISYILLCGYPPFYGDSDSQIFDSVRAGKFDFPSPEWDTVSKAAKDFVCSLLKKDPAKRPTATQAMQHKWILQYASGKSITNPRVQHSKRRSLIFKSYMGMKKLKKAALGHIATHLNPAEIEHLGKVFESIDLDVAGNLTLKELDSALTSECFSPDLLQRLRNLREDLSLTGDERVNWKDFYDAMLDKSLLMKEDKIRLAFDLFRKKENHCLQLDELFSVLGGEKATRDIIDLDDIKGNRISYEEFKGKLTGSFLEINDESE